MSYILDALKKAEEERRRNSDTGGQKVQEELSPPPRRRKTWPYLILMILLVNILLIIWWTEPWNTGTVVSFRKAPEGEQSHEENQAESIREMASLNGDSPEPLSPSPLEDKPVPKDAAAVLTDSSPGKKANETIGENNVRTGAELKEKNDPDRPAAPDTTGVAQSDRHPENRKETLPGDRIYALNELPSSILQDLPDMSISLLYYTEDPESRLISIKDRTLREGNELVPGVKLLGIDSNSAIFGYRNYLFRVAVNTR